MSPAVFELSEQLHVGAGLLADGERQRRLGVEWLGFDDFPMPSLQLQKHPQSQRGVRPIRLVVANHDCYCTRFNVSMDAGVGCEQEVRRKMPQLCTEPLLQGNAESHLGTIEDLVRDE